MIYDDIKKAQSEQRARILKNFKNIDEKTAVLITKADFESEYPKDKFEWYSPQSLTKFRTELSKAEGVTNADEAFKQATTGFKGFVVVEGEKKAIVFVRKKEAGE